MNDDDRRAWLTTAEATAQLGVKPATLYAYVSRGLLPSRRAEGGRGSLFHRDDIARLAARGAAARTSAPELVVRSSLTELGDGVLRYRGHDVTALVGTASFEAVAELLWTGELVQPPPWQAHAGAAAVAGELCARLPAGTPLLERLRVACSVAAAVHPLGGPGDTAALQATGRVVLATLVAALPAVGEGDGGGLAARLWRRLAPRTPTEAEVALLDAALVALADHELAASTFSARVAASARCDPWAVVECGLAAVSGTLHGRSSLAVERLLTGLTAGDVEARLAAQVREHGGIPGFGHRVHRTGDPRAVVLLDRLRAVAPASATAGVDALLDAAAGRAVGPPNVDLALAAVTTALGMPHGAAEAVFAVARCAGWLAHAFEQYAEGQLIRPRALYVGAG